MGSKQEGEGRNRGVARRAPPMLISVFFRVLRSLAPDPRFSHEIFVYPRAPILKVRPVIANELDPIQVEICQHDPLV